ncbi:hypothetical protein A7J67_14805 [Achromobacter xylosoxidans]|nr:hypothetical protein A7J67_14805 [Achromobacter xylosoxidans]
MLAFGLRWFALIGSNVPKLARSRGRRLRATHYVVGGSPAMVAGYGRGRPGLRTARSWRRARSSGTVPPQSAAQLFALLYPEGGHSLVRLPDGRHWLVAAHGGAVLSQTDRVFDSRDDAQLEQRALLAQRPSLTEHSPDQVWAALAQAVESGAALTVLPSRWAELPAALRLFFACIGLAAVAPSLWNANVNTFARKPAAPPEPAAVRDPMADAYQAMLQGTTVHPAADLTRLLASVAALPVQVQGWALRRAHCDAAAQQWDCAAVYARAHPLATNHGLHALLPAGWHVSFKPLEQATLAWRVAAAPIRVVDMALPTSLHVDTRVAGGLQGLRPAFASVALSTAVPLMPRLPAAARAVASPADPAGWATPLVRRRSLVLHGPLRSMALLPGPVPAARWSRLVVNVQSQPRPSLVASALVAELHGDLYEQE